MQFSIIKDARGTTQGVRIERNGESLSFNIATYSKTSDRSVSVNPETMFDEFNQYVATLGDGAQNYLFEQYQEAHQTFQRRIELSALTTSLVNIAQCIFQHLDQAKIRAWIVNKSRIRIPTSLVDQFNADESQEYQNRTYLRTHYLDLAALALSLRAMVPIWGQYIHVCEETSGNIMKEFVAMQLLYKTGVSETPAFQRLSTYIQSFIDAEFKDRPKAAPILSGLSSSDLQSFILSLTVVRRLSIGELSSPNDGSHIITNLYQFIHNAVRSLEGKFGKSFGGRIRDKKETIRNSRASDEQTVSVVEMYKIVQSIPDGDVVALNYYTEDVHAMALKIDPTVDLELVDLCLASASVLNDEPILPHAVAMAQWIIHRVMSPKAGQSLNKAAIIRSIAVSQAVLWHWGLYDLAGLITATKINTSNALGLGYNEHRPRVKQEQAEELLRMTPHVQMSRSRSGAARGQCPSMRSVEAFSGLLSHSDWRLNCPDRLLALIPGRSDRSRKMVVPGDIRTQLSQVLFHTNRDYY